MIWYYAVYCLVSLGLPTCLVDDRNWRRVVQQFYFLCTVPTLILFSGLRSSAIDRDYANYHAWFDWVASGSLVGSDWRKDPAFVLVSYVVAHLGWAYAAVALIYATCAMLAQLEVSKQVSGGRWLTLYFYLVICRTFIPENMTAVRASVAIPLMSVSFVLAARGEKRRALILYLIALCFHLSALIGLPVLVLALLNVQILSRWWIISLAPVAICVKISLWKVLTLLSGMDRVSHYIHGDYSTKGISLLSVYFIVRVLALLIIFSFYWRKLSKEQRLATMASSIGVFIQIVLSSNDALALRGAEVFVFFDLYIFMIPLDHLKGIRRVLYMAGLVLLGLVFFRSSLKTIEPYHWSLT